MDRHCPFERSKTFYDSFAGFNVLISMVNYKDKIVDRS